MDGIHDMGGMDGFGRIELEDHEPPFHARWEGRVLAMQRAMAYVGVWDIDHFRFALERLPPHVQLGASYYERWALAIEINVIERGLASAEELKAGHALARSKQINRKLTTDLAQQALIRPSFQREPHGPARFKPGDQVRTRNIHPSTHTRLPRYAQGKIGIIERCHGCQVFPDSAAINLGDDPQWLYTVVFEGRELWGAEADPTLKVSIDAFEPYFDLA
jgi:nitrile hydratase subunit beta